MLDWGVVDSQQNSGMADGMDAFTINKIWNDGTMKVQLVVVKDGELVMVGGGSGPSCWSQEEKPAEVDSGWIKNNNTRIAVIYCRPQAGDSIFLPATFSCLIRIFLFLLAPSLPHSYRSIELLEGSWNYC